MLFYTTIFTKGASFLQAICK